MGINRPKNLNIRDVPGNGSIVGPSTSPSLGVSTSTCFSSTSGTGPCSLLFDNTVLGLSCTFCGCAVGNVCCSCNCTVYDRRVPSGMWKSSEQYTASKNNAWGDDISISSAAVFNCVTGITTICGKSACNVCVGGRIFCVGSNIAYIVAPSASQVTRFYPSRNDAVTSAQSVTGCTDWFVPNISLLASGRGCRSYWDTFAGSYMSSTLQGVHSVCYVHFPTGNVNSNPIPATCTYIRAFRCVTY